MVEKGSHSHTPPPGAPDFFRAILTRRRSPGLIPCLGFHPRAFRRGPEHELGWVFAGAGGGAFRQSAAPDVRTARPGPDIFFELCVGCGGPRARSSVSGSTHACPGGAPNIGIFEIEISPAITLFFKEYLKNFGTKIEISPAITLFFLGLGN